MLSTDEEELVNQFPLVARVFISNLVKAIEAKEKYIEAKEKLSRFLMAQANTRYLKVSGDLSIRRVLEESEQEEIVRLTKKRFKLEAQKQAKLITGDNINKNLVPNLSKRDLWDRVLNDSNESKRPFSKFVLVAGGASSSYYPCRFVQFLLEADSHKSSSCASLHRCRGIYS